MMSAAQTFFFNKTPPQCSQANLQICGCNFCGSTAQQNIHGTRLLAARCPGKQGNQASEGSNGMSGSYDFITMIQMSQTNSKKHG
jgi:hypothetical protein